MQFAAWVDEFEAVDVPSDLAGLDRALFHQDRYMAKLVAAVAEMDGAGLWEVDGAPSAAAWLGARGIPQPDAHRLVLMARKLKQLAVLAEAWLRGQINGGQVQVVNANVVTRHVELFASHETELVPSLVGLSVGDTVRAMSLWRARADALNDGPAPRDPVSEARLSRTLDDRGVMSASLDAEGFALATAALNIADTHDLDVPACQRRGQALKDIFRWFLDHQDIKTPGRRRPHLNIAIREETIHTDQVEGFDIETGVRIDSNTLQRLLCDCEFHRLLLAADSTVLDYGRSVKDPPVELYNAVVARDQHCRGCGRPASWCHVHHVRWWKRHKGKTKLGNLVLLCARCHGLVHRNGWSAVLHLDGRFDIITPWDDVRSTYPPDALPRPDLDWGDQPRLLDRQPPPWYTGEDPEDDTDYNALIRARLLLNRLGVAA
jgi:hypothetical protein